MNRRILLINDLMHAGGVEAVLQSIAGELVDKGEKVTIWAQDGDKQTLAEKFPPSVKFRRYPFWEIPCKRFSLIWWYRRISKRLYEKLFLKFRKWDAVLALKEGPSMILASKLRAKKKIAWVHTDYKTFRWTDYCFPKEGSELACMRKFDRVVCVSDAVKQSIIETLGDPCNLCRIYNPINYKSILSLSADVPQDCIKPSKPLFVSVGRLTEVKRYDMLMDICKELSKEFDFELWIIGGGELEKELRLKLQRDNISCVKLLGQRNNPYPYIAAADWLVSSSASESFGLTVQESLILGNPVIASYCAAISETLDDRFGLVMSTEPDALKRGMAEILRQPEITEKYRDNIRRYYNRDELWQQRLDDIYNLI